MADKVDFNWAPIKWDADGNWSVQNGTPNNTSESTVGTGTLGKDAFLKLLTTQMQYQDPLNPTSDTEWIAQMAQFSALEAMQNMCTAMENSEAFSLVGKYVIVDENAVEAGGTGTPNLKAGKVDYVTISNGKAYLVMGEDTYSYDQLDSVVSEEYIKNMANSGTGNETDDNKTENNSTDSTDTTKTENE